MTNTKVFISGLLFVVVFVGIQLFRNQNISMNDFKNYSIVFIIAFVLIIASLLYSNSNVEHFADTVPVTSNEALQNLASMYANGNLTVSSLTVTGKSNLQGDTTITGNSSVTGNSAVTGNSTIGGTATITGKTSLLGDTNVGKNITMFADPSAQDKLQIKPDGNAPGYLYFNKGSVLGLANVPSPLTVASPVIVGGDTTVNGKLTVNGKSILNDDVHIGYTTLYFNSQDFFNGFDHDYDPNVKPTNPKLDKDGAFDVTGRAYTWINRSHQRGYSGTGGWKWMDN